ncbi:MAG: signal peptide peptidase SppA [Flavobacteriales bacterium]|nr:signal peptide peptidase SppA [Flavobacteriales bacterium]
MKQFFKYFFAAVAAIVFVSFLFFISIMIMGSLADQEASIEENTLLKLELNAPIVDRAAPNPFDKLGGGLGSSSTIGLTSILKSIEKAQKDENIKGILLDISMLNAGMASVEEIRDALIEFKSSDKFIISYSEIYSQKSLYLASIADESYVFPEGLVEFRGLRSTRMFMKGALEKLDIEAQIIRHGKFKSAVEPFILEGMSEANKEQTMTYLQDLWDHMVKGISEARGIPEAELENIANKLLIREAEDAVQYKLVDATLYKDQLLDTLRSRIGLEKDDKIKAVSLNKYERVKLDGDRKIKSEKVAVVYAFGDIVSGEGDKESIGSENISKQIRKAREDDKVKAIVLRVNSPGGSALASDVIWREVGLAKKEKPVIVSMGDVAASGGYYISCEADKIFASENTITGSIGVFGVIPNMQGFFNNKLGLTFDGVQTNDYADLGALYRPLTQGERDIIQQSVENIYDDFIEKVGQGRDISKADVDSIGQGRVWSGSDAKEIGLVDEFGGLNAAIKEAAKMANLTDYKLLELPKKKEPVEQLMEDLFGTGGEARVIEKHLGSSFKYFKYLQSVSKLNGIQMQLPYLLEIE